MHLALPAIVWIFGLPAKMGRFYIRAERNSISGYSLTGVNEPRSCEVCSMSNGGFVNDVSRITRLLYAVTLSS